MTHNEILSEVEVRFSSFFFPTAFPVALGAVNIEQLLKESNIRNPGYFVIVMGVLYSHGAEAFAKTK